MWNDYTLSIHLPDKFKKNHWHYQIFTITQNHFSMNSICNHKINVVVTTYFKLMVIWNRMDWIISCTFMPTVSSWCHCCFSLQFFLHKVPAEALKCAQLAWHGNKGKKKHTTVHQGFETAWSIIWNVLSFPTPSQVRDGVPNRKLIEVPNWVYSRESPCHIKDINVRQVTLLVHTDRIIN